MRKFTLGSVYCRIICSDIEQLSPGDLLMPARAPNQSDAVSVASVTQQRTDNRIGDNPNPGGTNGRGVSTCMYAGMAAMVGMAGPLSPSTRLPLTAPRHSAA